MPVELTEPIQKALDATGPPLPVVDPRTNSPYVIISAAMFERVEALLDDDTVYATAELVDRVMAEDDAHDPYLSDLQRQLANCRTH